LELYQQTIARIYRQGQIKPVVVEHLVVKDSIEERVMSALTSKQTTQDALLDAVKAELTRKD